MARTILHYGTEYLGTSAQLGVIPEGVLIVDPDTNTIRIGNGVDAGGVNVTVQADVAWADITGKPANLDAISGDSTDFTYNAATNTLTVNGTVDTNTITANTYNFNGATVNNLDYSSISNTPTTLAGYGITDAQSILVSGTNIKTVNGTSLLGSGDVVVSGTTINNNADNRIITGSATANTLEAESTFTFDGTDVFIPQYIKHDGNTDTRFGFGGVNYITMSINGFQALEVLNNEFNIPNFNVGIGNTDPQEKLDVTGNIVASGTITANTFSGNIDDATVTTGLSFGNIVKANFGDSDELQIFSNSSQAKSFIKTDTNTLTLSTNNIVRIQNSGGFGAFEADVDGSTDLYYNFVKKFETTNTGVAVNGDLTFYNDAGDTVVGYIRNNNDRLEFNNRNGLRMFYFFDEGDQDIQVERALVIASNQYLSTPKIQQNQGATGGIEITGGEAGTVVIQTGTNNEINVTNGLVDITGNVTISGTMSASNVLAVDDLKGSVFGDDSTLLVDAVNNQIPYSVIANSPIKAYAHVDVSAPITASASFNVASVTSSATGKYDVTFTNALPNANYVVSLSVQTNVTSNHYTVCYYNRSTTGFQVQKFLDGVLDSGASGNFSFVIYQA